MRKVPVPYSITADQKLIIAELRWPKRCVCCGTPTEAGAAILQHIARETSETISTSISRTTKSSGYPLAWNVPSCPTCLQHQAIIARRASIAVILLVLGFLLALGSGYALFLAGLAYNTLAVVGYAVFLGLLAFGGIRINSWFSKLQVKKARRIMTPACSSPTLAVVARSDFEQIVFAFDNESYAEEFAAINGL